MYKRLSNKKKDGYMGLLHTSTFSKYFLRSDSKATSIKVPCNYRGEPTELCDRNYHRNKTILSWSNGMTSLNRKYYGVRIERSFYHRKLTFRLKK